VNETADMATEKLRLDKYLWAIRVFKTRTQATAAIDEGKVKLAGVSVKASRAVSVGDRYDIKTPARKWTIEVTGLIHNRVAYEEAIKNYIDLTSEEDLKMNQRIATSFYTGKRLSKTGRPSKKQRRDLSDLHAPEEPEID
jgi:ribosome-associated heat shock protein Hsp15